MYNITKIDSFYYKVILSLTIERRYVMFSKQESINFIIGLIFNQSYDSDIAWKAPILLRKRLNTLSIDLIDVEKNGLESLKNTICKYPCLHRFPTKIASYTYNSISIINSIYNGDPRKIWSSKNHKQIMENFKKLDGIGEHKAIQGLLILNYLDDSIKVPKKYYDYIEKRCPSFLKNIQIDINYIISDE